MRVVLASFAFVCVLGTALPAFADLTVSPTVLVTPAAASVTAGDHVAFAATGGNGVYTWSLAAAPSGGSIDASGAYVAGPNGDTDDVVVLTDALGNATEANVHVGARIATNPIGSATPPATSPPAPELNLAGGADADNRCAVRGVGARSSTFGAAALALALAFSLTRRRRA